MASPTFSKFIRPEDTDEGRISDRDLDILEAILRYRFSPTSELVRLVGGNEDVSNRRLLKLWEWGLINRFVFPGIRTHSEFHYYLDNRRALEVLVEYARLKDIHPTMVEELRGNREKHYADAAGSRPAHATVLAVIRKRLFFGHRPGALLLPGRAWGGCSRVWFRAAAGIGYSHV